MGRDGRAENNCEGFSPRARGGSVVSVADNENKDSDGEDGMVEGHDSISNFLLNVESSARAVSDIVSGFSLGNRRLRMRIKSSLGFSIWEGNGKARISGCSFDPRPEIRWCSLSILRACPIINFLVSLFLFVFAVSGVAVLPHCTPFFGQCLQSSS